MPKRDRPQPTRDQVLDNLAKAVKTALTATVKVATAAALKSGVVTAAEIKETVDKAAGEWVPE